jgi:hypothetical protein
MRCIMSMHNHPLPLHVPFYKLISGTEFYLNYRLLIPFLTEYEAALFLAIPWFLYVLQPKLREKIHISTSSTRNGPYWHTNIGNTVHLLCSCSKHRNLSAYTILVPYLFPTKESIRFYSSRAPRHVLRVKHLARLHINLWVRRLTSRFAYCLWGSRTVGRSRSELPSSVPAKIV